MTAKHSTPAVKWLAVIVPILLCVAPVSRAAEREAAPPLPADVAAFKERRDLCDHFRGEEPYDAERRKFLHENLHKYCAGTDKALASLKAKYKGNRAVTSVLVEYEERIEAGD